MYIIHDIKITYIFNIYVHIFIYIDYYSDITGRYTGVNSICFIFDKAFLLYIQDV